MNTRKAVARKKRTGKKNSSGSHTPPTGSVKSYKNTKQSKPRGSPSKKLLFNLLEYYAAPVSREEAAMLWEYHTLLRSSNTDSDLTRLHSFDTIVQRHYADCLLPIQYLAANWPSPLLDIGTGAGFPGIILKIRLPAIRVILAEPRPRRVSFLKKVISELGLRHIRVFDHRVTPESFKENIKGCITRAFASMAKTLDLTEALLPPGGKCILMKGPGARQELLTLEAGPFKIIQNTQYKISHTPQKRSLLVFER